MLNDITNEKLASDMAALSEIIQKSVYSEIRLVEKVAEHITQASGKRLRPQVLMLAARALGYEGIAHQQFAAVIELTHTATLLHDDVVDESTLRRGLPSANRIFGNAASVLVGDFLYSRAFHMTLEANTSTTIPVMRALSQASTLIAEGEVLQLMNCRNADITEENYRQVIDYKTAKLFEASAKIGAIVADASPEVENAFALYGKHLGLAFQLIDDALDYSGQEEAIGKHLGDDLAEGKTTLPLIYALEKSDKNVQKMIRHAIETGGREYFSDILKAIEQTNALKYTKEAAQKEADLAIAALQKLAHLPASPYKEHLLKLPLFAVSRSF